MDKTVIILIGAGVCCVVIGFALFVKLLTTKSNDDDETTENCWMRNMQRTSRNALKTPETLKKPLNS